QNVVSPYLHAFEDVFIKASFDLLLKHKQWDHAIELLPNSMPSSCKVYLLASREQDELNAFLQENLDSSYIHPSKSPIASPVFFIRKKDRKFASTKISSTPSVSVAYYPTNRVAHQLFNSTLLI
ncbi:hypothetical protein J132_06719, partial [Termitomyces sp. J132]